MLETLTARLAVISADCAAAAFLSLSARDAFDDLTPSGARSATRNSTIFVTTFSADLTMGSQTSLMDERRIHRWDANTIGATTARDSVGSSANDGEVRPSASKSKSNRESRQDSHRPVLVGFATPIPMA